MSRKTRTKIELVNASGHLCYEIWMVHHMGHSLATGLAGQGPIHNALVNSFAVHVRNLIEFLYDQKGDSKSDAILAEDYFEIAADWTSKRQELPPVLRQAKIRCEKQVAHLTYTRERKETWDFVMIVKELHIALSVFMASVDRSLLGTYFGQIEHLFPKK